MSARKGLNVEINFDSKQEVTKKLNTLLKDIQKDSNIELDIDTKSINTSLEALSVSLTNISKQMQNAFNTSVYVKNQGGLVDGVTKSYEKQAEAMAKVNNVSKQSKTVSLDKNGNVDKVLQNVTVLNEGLGKTTTIVENVSNGFTKMETNVNFDKINKELDNFNAKKLKMQQDLNVNKGNGFLDNSTFDKLQKKLDKINTDTPQKDIKKLETDIGNLSNSENKVLRLQKIIDNAKSTINGLKENSSNFLNLDENKAKLDIYEAELKNAEKLIRNLKGNSPNVTLAKYNNVSTGLSDSASAVSSSVNSIKKETEDYIEEQRQVELLKKNKIELLNLDKQKSIRKYGETVDTSALDNSITKIKSLDDISLQGLKEEFKSIDIDIKQATEDAIKLSNFNKDKIGMQSKVSGFSNNGLIDESVINNLQSKLNSINTNTPEKEIKELQSTINNLGSSDSQIVKVQSAISKMESSLTGMKGKYGSLVGDSSSISELQKYESELNKLKEILAQLKNGSSFGGAKLTSELNQASESSRNLKTSVVNSANALKLAQTDATTFGSALKTAFQNAGLYMSTYQAINMVFTAFKDGLKTVIDMNTEMANLNKVVNMSKEQLNSMSDSAVQMGKGLGQSSIEVAKAQAEFGRMYKDSDTINGLSKTAIMGANVMDGASTAEVAKSLTTIVSSLKLEAKDSMTILDSMNEIKCVSPYTVMCKLNVL